MKAAAPYTAVRTASGKGDRCPERVLINDQHARHIPRRTNPPADQAKPENSECVRAASFLLPDLAGGFLYAFGICWHAGRFDQDSFWTAITFATGCLTACTAQPVHLGLVRVYWR